MCGGREVARAPQAEENQRARAPNAQRRRESGEARSSPRR